MFSGPGKSSSHWGVPEHEQAAELLPAQTRSRWGTPAPEPAEQPEQPPAHPTPPGLSRWGTPLPEPAEETEQQTHVDDTTERARHSTQGDQPAPTEEAPLFPMTPPAAPEALPLPLPQPAAQQNPLRQQRSSAWLEQLHADDTPSPPPIQPRARTRPRLRRATRLSLIIVPLCVVLLLGALLFSVPAFRQRALGLILPTSTATASPQGSLLAQSNIAGSVLSLNHQTYQMSTPVNGGWSVTVSHLNIGTYPLTISAPNYAPASGQVGILPSLPTVVRAFLTLDKTVYTSLLPPANNLIPGPPLAASIPAGAQYRADQTAAQALKVSIGYRVLSLVDTPDPSTLMVGDTGPSAPKTLLSGVVVPVALFTDSTSSAVVAETQPDALPPAHFLLALTLALDSSGSASFALATPAVLKATTATDAALSVPGGISADPALLFALVSISLSQGVADNSLSCLGLLDAVQTAGSQPDPEDGFLFGVNGGTAHYFFRWGQVWTTNAAAHTLTPTLPQANLDTLVQAQTIINAQTQGQPTGCQ